MKRTSSSSRPALSLNKAQVTKQIKFAKSVLMDIVISYTNKDGRYGKFAYDVQNKELLRLQSLIS